MKAVLIVEDDPDIQLLIQALFAMDPRFLVAGLVDSADEAIEMTGKLSPAVIVLDDDLAGETRGIDAVARIKAVAPDAKIIMFTSHQETKARTDGDPSVDAFLLKTDIGELLPVAQQLTHLLALI